MLAIVTDSSFDKFLRQHRLAVIDFWAPWCHPCLKMEPRVSELSKEFGGEVAFGKMNTDENPKITKRLRINSIPAFFVFKNGVVEDSFVGSAPKRELAKFISDTFGL